MNQLYISILVARTHFKSQIYIRHIHIQHIFIGIGSQTYCQDLIACIWQPGSGSLDLVSRTWYLGCGGQDPEAWIQQPGCGSQDVVARIWQPGLVSILFTRTASYDEVESAIRCLIKCKLHFRIYLQFVVSTLLAIIISKVLAITEFRNSSNFNFQHAGNYCIPKC